MATISDLIRGSTGHVIFTPWYSKIEDGKYMEPAPSGSGMRGFQPVVRRNVDSYVAWERSFFGCDVNFCKEYGDLMGDLEGVQAVTFKKLIRKNQEPVQVGIKGFFRKSPVYEDRLVERPVNLSGILEKYAVDEPAGVFQYDVRDMAGYDGRYKSYFTYSIFLGKDDFERVKKEVTKDPQIIPDTGRELFPFWFEYLEEKVKLKEPIRLILSLDDVKPNPRRL